MHQNQLVKPEKRSNLRLKIGKWYFCQKRKFEHIKHPKKWAKNHATLFPWHPVFKHQSLILRPLKDVDMYLQENKRTNLKLAIAHMDQVVIKPGELFSLWHLVGKPTKRKGYLEGLVLNQGKIDKGIGGGLCQLGNLLFWLFAHSPLLITERHRHSFDVFPDVNRQVPFGAGATLSYNYLDFQVINPTEHSYQLHLWLDETYLHGELRCSEKPNASFSIEEQNHQIKHQLWGGYSRHNQLVQLEKRADGSIYRRIIAENHALMCYNPFLESVKK